MIEGDHTWIIRHMDICHGYVVVFRASCEAGDFLRSVESLRQVSKDSLLTSAERSTLAYGMVIGDSNRGRHMRLPEAFSLWTKFGRAGADGREWANAETTQPADGEERHLPTQG
jgi:hypothetical protein